MVRISGPNARARLLPDEALAKLPSQIIGHRIPSIQSGQHLVNESHILVRQARNLLLQPRQIYQFVNELLIRTGNRYIGNAQRQDESQCEVSEQ